MSGGPHQQRNSAARIEVSIVVIKTPEGYVFERRVDNAAAGQPNKLGCYGGKLEADETAMEAARRELKEEIGVEIENLAELGSVVVSSDHNLKMVTVTAHVFFIELETQPQATSSDSVGQPVTISEDQLPSVAHEMTPASLATFKTLIPILKGEK